MPRQVSLQYILLFALNIYSTTPYISTYLDSTFTKKINPKEINLVLEIGSRHCLDAIALYNHYKCPVIAFECIPSSIQECKKNIQNYPYITLVEKAIWEKTEVIDFYHCISHPACSSAYPLDYNAMAEYNHSNNLTMAEKWPMNRITVEAVRLDEWLQENNIKQVDLICIDVQGAALSVLKSLGEHLKNIKYIITEVEYKPIYYGEALFDEINSFMQANYFTPILFFKF